MLVAITLIPENYRGPTFTFLLGAATLAFGQWITHRYALKRERRSEMTATLDRTIEGFVAADKALAFLIREVDFGKPEKVVQAAADEVSVHEVTMRASLFSLRVRVSIGHPIEEAFKEAESLFIKSWMALGPAIASRGKRKDSIEAARTLYGEFRSQFDEALDMCRAALELNDY